MKISKKFAEEATLRIIQNIIRNTLKDRLDPEDEDDVRGVIWRDIAQHAKHYEDITP